MLLQGGGKGASKMRKRPRTVCMRKACDWRDANGLCLMAHKCPYGERYILPDGKEAVHDKR